MDEPMARWMDGHSWNALVTSAPLGRRASIAADDLPPGTRLTRREREILPLLAMRLTDSEIGERLYISRRTASSHVASILAKLGVANRRQAVAVAGRNGLV